MNSPRPLLCKVVSGGQIGADIAALDWAISRGIPHGGWCPKGRRAEGGRIPDRYQLLETTTSDYQTRTRLNVDDSGATVIFTTGSHLSGGTLLTFRLAQALGKPVLHLHESTTLPERRLLACLNEHGGRDAERGRASRFSLSLHGQPRCERPRPNVRRAPAKRESEAGRGCLTAVPGRALSTAGQVPTCARSAPAWLAKASS